MVEDRKGSSTPAPIFRGACYALDDFSTRSGLGVAGTRAARRNGLIVHYGHSRGWVSGDDWADYVDKLPTTAPGPSRGDTPACVQRQQELPFPAEDDDP